MRVFISEFVCGGGWPEPEIAGSLAQEGRAMLRAIVADFARIPEVKVTMTWDARLGAPPLENVQTIVVDSAVDELPIFRELADLCDATLVIAPETHGLLEKRCRIVEGTRTRLLGSGSGAVGLCANKLDTARCLIREGVPAIPTRTLPSIRAGRSHSDSSSSTAVDCLTFPLVVKPNDGAGSQSTWLIRDKSEFDRLRTVWQNDPLLSTAICQPYVHGRAVSIAVLVSTGGERIEMFPAAEQNLSNDGRFRYLGGILPARDVDSTAIENTARNACCAIKGLRGYVGVDLVVPDANPNEPLVVEINPRLTTSYIGYRQLTEVNLAERILNPANTSPIVWHEASVAFSACGSMA